MPPASNWEVVFFASPRSVDFFIPEDFSLTANQEIACIGPETKKHLETLGYQVSFYGEQAGNPKEIAAQFKTWLGERRALFPQSTKSNKSIESEIPGSQKISLIVYETISDPVPFLNSFSVYVFTSPSNYKSFMTLNKLPEEAKVIAWGRSTAETMMDDDAPVHFILDTSTYSELLEILQKILTEN
ncbi:uroporphyrinogen-III synthase [Fluviicola sp.]|uniref:uroporphyrinogen-III synthase n=1 Tax=Fluviicola sp. TaxID=1917219 RepID=UPI0031D97143